MGVYHIDKSTVENQQTGYSVQSWMADQADATAIAEPTAPFSNPEDENIVTGDHTFGVDQGFARCYSLPNTSEGTGESFGELGALNTMVKHKVFFPGDGAKLYNALQKLKNKDLIFLVEDATNPSGPVMQYGDRKIPANISSINFTSGNAFDGKKGYEVEIQAKSRYEYQGTITEQA